MTRVNTYADPLLVSPLSLLSYVAPITTVSPSIDTLMPNRSSARAPAVSLATCVQPEVRLPAVSRVNTYADPLLVSPSSLSSYFAPITTVSPSIDTL